MLKQLKNSVCQANLALVRHGLVVLTWGNVSGFDAARGLVVIKPSGVPYDRMQPDDMVVVDLDGRVVEGQLKPSSDLPTHLVFYRTWPQLGGVVHTHSAHATMFAQACLPIPCYGTTHADHFYGAVPCTRLLRPEETQTDYEFNTGKVIVERFGAQDPLQMPGVVVAGHGPFTWGASVGAAVENAVALEEVARMAIGARLLNPALEELPAHVLDKHFLRKHGPGAYYGQA